MITTDLIMSTRPCADYPRPRVEELLLTYGPFASWEAMAIAARDAGWPVSLADLRLTAYRAATPAQRETAVRHSTRIRVECQQRRWPDVPSAAADVRRRLLAWADGADDDIAKIRTAAAAAAYAACNSAAAACNSAAAAAYAAAAAAYAAATAAYAAAAYAAACNSAAYAAAADVADAADAADADAADAAAMWESLLYICRLLDAAGQTGARVVP